MSEGISRVLARIQEIQSLIGESSRSNEEFGSELDRSLRSRSACSAERNTQDAICSTPEDLTPLIEEAAGKTGLPGELISAVMATESGYRADAVSPTGAMGLMQLMPGTARALGVEDPYNPRQNILGGAEYLRHQLAHFGSIEQALAAYNAGPRAVEQYGGIPPFGETQEYVRRVLQKLRQLTNQRE
jgi:soluble lytic murein transglycosylase-like protein